MQRMMSFLAGVMAGAVVGSVAALLLAPLSGSELQERVRTQVKVVITEAREAVDDRRAELETRLQSLKQPPAATDD